jgi:hypothetical protein
MATGATPGDRNGEVPSEVEPKHTFGSAAEVSSEPLSQSE